MDKITKWNREDEIKNINKIQDEYVQELKTVMLSELPVHKAMKAINFTSPTGTGKTKMMAKLINSMPDWFFVITTLSRGQLNKQVEESLNIDCKKNNFISFGAMSLKTNSVLKSSDIIAQLPNDKKICWIRDEGHIDTKNWFKTLEERCDKIINFSATNQDDGGIVCNFTSTMMLRTVNQNDGSPEDAIQKLIDVKKAHRNVTNYNPCLICRVVNSSTVATIEQLCEKYNLQFISIVDNVNFNMADICQDNNKYDVIINKQKIVEGIDIRRAHVLWLENQPKNVATIIQIIGRCRRNALLWRNDIDIVAEENEELLEQTRQCYVFYNVSNTSVETDENGELAISFCPYISIQKLKPGHTIYVKNGQMKNGLYVCELKGKTGKYEIQLDEETGFNVVENIDCYQTKVVFNNIVIDSWLEALNSLSNKSTEYWQNLQQWYEQLIEGKQFLHQKYTLHKKNGKIDRITYYPTFDEHGNIETKIENQSLFHIKMQRLLRKKENNNWIDTLDKFNKFGDYYQYIEIHKIGLTINNKIWMLTLKELEYVINHHEFHCCALDIANRTTSFYRFSQANAIINWTELTPHKQNNRLLSILGIDIFRQVKKNGEVTWIPSRAVTDRLSKTSKLDAYIESCFCNELDSVQNDLFYNENHLGFDKKCNSCIGYCVEYYAKYKIFGEGFLGKFIKKATSEFEKEAKKQQIGRKNRKVIIIRACMLKYKEEIADTYGKNISFIVPSITVHQLIQKDMKKFVQLIDTLGTEVAEFVQANCSTYKAGHTNNRLVTEHLVGLMDICDSETIIDIKCTNKIDRHMIKQVLAYALLSSYRSDLNIKTVIVYDAVSKKHVKLDVTETIKQDYDLSKIKHQTIWEQENKGRYLYMDKRDFTDNTNYQMYISQQEQRDIPWL